MPGTSTSGGRRSAGKSRAEHERAGTFRKDRHADLKNPEPPLGRPKEPSGLDETGQAEWGRMMWRLEQSQTLAVVDDGSIYQYCKLFAETEHVAAQQSEARASIKILEENIRDVNGPELVELFRQVVILRQLVSKATDQLRAGRMAIRQYLVEFGLTPASRGRIKLPAKQEKVDEFTAFQKKRGAA